MKQQKIGLIGLGKMGFRIAERLLEKDYIPVATDLNSDVVKKIEKKGAIGVSSVGELINNLPSPRIILLLIPAGEEIDRMIEELLSYLSKDDIIIDMGNSFYKDSQRRSTYLQQKGIFLIDAGISGGVDGARNGACLMVGGDKEAFERAKNIFEVLSQNNSYEYLGKSGSGHLVKGYHNLIEYGYLQALVEGLVCISKISNDEGMDIKLEDVCDIWGKGSIVESRITRDAMSALKDNPTLDGINGSVLGQTQKEMEELVRIAHEKDIGVPSCGAALNARIESQKKPTFAGKIINAIRNVFGGHEEWKRQ